VIAKEAVTYGNSYEPSALQGVLIGIIARDDDFDAVLIDTAGHLRDNEVCIFFRALDKI
jgi:hypothetical protein